MADPKIRLLGLVPKLKSALGKQLVNLNTVLKPPVVSERPQAPALDHPQELKSHPLIQNSPAMKSRLDRLTFPSTLLTEAKKAVTIPSTSMKAPAVKINRSRTPTFTHQNFAKVFRPPEFKTFNTNPRLAVQTPTSSSATRHVQRPEVSSRLQAVSKLQAARIPATPKERAIKETKTPKVFQPNPMVQVLTDLQTVLGQLSRSTNQLAPIDPFQIGPLQSRTASDWNFDLEPIEVPNKLVPGGLPISLPSLIKPFTQ